MTLCAVSHCLPTSMTPAATAKTLTHNLTKLADDKKKKTFLTGNTVLRLEVEFLSFVEWMIIG